MRTLFSVTAAISMMVGTASAQSPILSNPIPNPVATAFRESIMACANYSGDANAELRGRCLGIRYGVLDVYMNTADLCIKTRSNQDCEDAQKVRKDTLEILKALK